MTRSPDDQIDPYESRLTRRVGDFAEQAVRPVDPMAVAAAAHAGARRRTLAGRLFGSAASMRRVGMVLAGALVAVVSFGIYIGAGGPTGQVSNSPAATETSQPAAQAACVASDLRGAVTGWEGAAGHRIAPISISNAGTTACLLPQYLRPALIDAGGRALMVGQLVSQPAPIELAAGAEATSMVDMANYCGAAPAKPLKIRLYLPDETSIELAAASSLPNPGDAPPCNGPNVPASIQMQALTIK